MSSPYRLVMVTAPDKETGSSLARGAVEQRLAACAKVLGPIESHYWWEDALERSEEYQLLFKTREACLEGLQSWITHQHPYDVPEYVVMEITAGSKAYLQWIDQETLAPKQT